MVFNAYDQSDALVTTAEQVEGFTSEAGTTAIVTQVETPGVTAGRVEAAVVPSRELDEPRHRSSGRGVWADDSSGPTPVPANRRCRHEAQAPSARPSRQYPMNATAFRSTPHVPTRCRRSVLIAPASPASQA